MRSHATPSARVVACNGSQTIFGCIINKTSKTSDTSTRCALCLQAPQLAAQGGPVHHADGW